jgi:hypothetical protein
VAADPYVSIVLNDTIATRSAAELRQCLAETKSQFVGIDHAEISLSFMTPAAFVNTVKIKVFNLRAPFPDLLELLGMTKDADREDTATNNLQAQEQSS